MPESESRALPESTNDTWRTWLMTGARRDPVDRRRVRGAHQGLKRMLLEGTPGRDDRPHAWRDFSGAMIRHAVDEAMRTLPLEDKQVVKLAYFGGYSNREIASETGLTEATVQRRLRRALAAISDGIQRGRDLGRKAVYGLILFLSGRWLSDVGIHLAPAVAAAAVTMVVISQPAPAPAASAHRQAAPAAHSSSTPPARPGVVPPLPSPTVPSVKLPVALPSLPVHVPPLRT